MILNKDGVITSPTEPTKNRRLYWYNSTNNKIYKLVNNQYKEIKKEINIITGEEFETLFTRNGKTVYGKEINCGPGPDAVSSNTRSIQTGLSNVTYVALFGMASNNAGITFPINNSRLEHNGQIGAFIQNNLILVESASNRSSYTISITVFYTKN